jgi:DNA-binding transcriptional regulator LsrR (DeoR family)
MPEDVSEDRLQLLADIAEWYYIGGLSQEEIAKRVDLSRPSISRLLLDAREQGIVEIRVNRPIPNDHGLERELKERFSLEEARVVQRRGADDQEALDLVGRLAAIVMDRHLQNGTVLGISWGTGVHAVIEALRPRRLPNVKVVQLIGGVGAPYRSIDGPEQVRRVGDAYGAQHYYLNAPMVVDSPEVAAALREDHSIKEVLELIQQTNLGLVGIGSINPEVSTQYHSGYITYDDLRRLSREGVVGAICASFFDIEGHYIPAPWFEDCVIGVDWEGLTRIGRMIAVAGGKRKAPAILGAMRTGLISTLITDDAAAEEALALADHT